MENCVIVLVEICPCDSKMELLKREKHYISNNKCVNKHIPAQTKREYYGTYKTKILEDMKEHYNNNKVHRKEYQKCYTEKNKEAIKIRDKIYRDKNKQNKIKYHKAYYEKNKENILEKSKEKIKEKVTCICGSVFFKHNHLLHKKTKKTMTL